MEYRLKFPHGLYVYHYRANTRRFFNIFSFLANLWVRLWSALIKDIFYFLKLVNMLLVWFPICSLDLPDRARRLKHGAGRLHQHLVHHGH